MTATNCIWIKYTSIHRYIFNRTNMCGHLSRNSKCRASWHGKPPCFPRVRKGSRQEFPMISISRPQFAAAALFAVSLLGVSIPQAHAQLTLTPAGVADGFTLDTFVGGYNFSGNYGPLAQGILPNGNVITGSMGDATIFVFPDSNNLTLGSAISATPYAFTTSNP